MEVLIKNSRVPQPTGLLQSHRWVMCFVALFCCLVSSRVLLAAQPNVLWIMSDDLRPQLGCYGDPLAITPNIDRFAKKSLRFDRAYVQSAVCSPSRNSMLSGLRPNTSGLRGFGVKLRDAIPDIITLPQHFKNNGYETRGFGKIYHIYDESMLGDENDPLSWSEPLQWPSVPVWGPKQNALRNQLIAKAKADGKVFNHPHDWPRAETWDNSDIPDNEMQDGNTTAMVEKYLEERKDDETPFFLAVGFLRPHLPFNAPKKYWDLYDPEKLPLPDFRSRPEGAPKWSVSQGIVKRYHGMTADKVNDEAFLKKYLQAYLACISYVDACFGRVISALEKSGQADNTIVVFMGDHGYQMGEYNSWGHKHSNFEISTRTPLIMHVPNMKSAGKETEFVVEFLDLYPTLCELTNLPKPKHLEGRSFVKTLDNTSDLYRSVACSEMKRGRFLGRSIRSSRFRYTEWRNPKNQLVARELYDHRDDASKGTLEKVNCVDNPQFKNEIEILSQQLHTIVPHDSKK